MSDFVEMSAVGKVDRSAWIAAKADELRAKGANHIAVWRHRTNGRVRINGWIKPPETETVLSKQDAKLMAVLKEGWERME